LITPSDYDDIATSSKHGYRVTTDRKEVFAVKELAIEDSILVIKEFKRLVRSSAYPRDSAAVGSDSEALINRIPLSRIERIEEKEVDFVIPLLFVGGIAAAWIYISSSLQFWPSKT